LAAQRQPDAVITLTDEQRDPRIAISEIRGPIGAIEAVDRFNDELWTALRSSGRLDVVPRSFYPRSSPRQPEDIQYGEKTVPKDPAARGLWAQGWRDVPVQSRYLVYGRVDETDGRLMLSGFLNDVTQESPEAAYIFGKRYFSEATATGARGMAFEFARDILMNLGLGQGLAGTRIYYVHKGEGEDRKEIWAMDYDGRNKRHITDYRNLCITPAVSPDGKRIAFTTFVEGVPKIYVHSLETGRRLQFYNQDASLNTTPSFAPDGTGVFFASSPSGRSQIYQSDADGGNLRRVSYSRSLDVDPSVNPKTGRQIAFVSDTTGEPQVYLMDVDGTNRRRLSAGGGDAVQPAWDPTGERLTFSWTRGYEIGNYNIFLVDVVSGRYTQLTHSRGRNEHPTFSPSGTHIVFASDRMGGTQIWSMRADGTQIKQLTSKGVNESPVWAVR
jgi:TolB protein